ncbi:MAG: 3D domain-containing protein [Polyangiales bacterium]
MRTFTTVPSFIVALALASAPLVGCGGSGSSSGASSSVAQGDTPGHGHGAAAMPDQSSGQGSATSSAALLPAGGTNFKLTYYVVSQRPDNDPDQVDIVDCDGKLLTKASTAWRDDAQMQGTARYKGTDGRMHTINDGSGCWITLPDSLQWGLGVDDPKTNQAFALSPFRSIAIDRKVLSLGDWYYVKELDGVALPAPSEGTVHDGCVRAVDVGPAIVGNHIDFFSGLFSAYQSLIKGNSTMGGKESVTLFPGAAKCAAHIASGT